jgi:predicted phosphodiesterase
MPVSTKNDFVGVKRNLSGKELDQVFDEFQSEVLFFGHDHSKVEKEGKAKYINPGSVGCSKEALARYTVAEISNGQINIKHRSVAYDDQELFEAFERRKAPEREFIYKIFFGGRFGA